MFRKISLACIAFLLILFFASATSQVAVVQMNPFFQENDLRVEIMLFNRGDSEGIASVTFTYFGQVFEPAIEAVPAQQSKRLVYNLQNIHVGKIMLAILSDENRFYEITIPENPTPNSEMLYSEVGLSTYRESAKEKSDIERFIDFVFLAVQENFLLLLGVVIAGLMVFYLIVTTFFRKKSRTEKEIEMNEKLLQEVEEIGKAKKKK